MVINMERCPTAANPVLNKSVLKGCIFMEGFVCWFRRLHLTSYTTETNYRILTVDHNILTGLL